VIRGIIEQTGVKIDVDDDGTAYMCHPPTKPAANKALQIIGDITAVAEVARPIWSRFSA